MRTYKTSLPGLRRVEVPVHLDARGAFVKLYQRSVYRSLSLPEPFVESFFTTSDRHVLRGLHLQTTPSEQWKLVSCLAGRAHDVVLDVREGSPTAGCHEAFTLDAKGGRALLIPPGCAHGFLALEPATLIAYAVTSEHDPAHDTGVRWDSAGVDWPLEGQPLVSPRDAALPALEDFRSGVPWSPDMVEVRTTP